MTLQELSKEYRASAEALDQRMRLLRAQAAEAGSEAGRQALMNRIRVLGVMRRETREIAALTEHYYERKYYRNAKYIL